METPGRLTDAEGADPRRPFVLFGLGYITLCVVTVWLDYKVQMRRALKRREARGDEYAPQEREWFKKGDDEPPDGK